MNLTTAGVYSHASLTWSCPWCWLLEVGSATYIKAFSARGQFKGLAGLDSKLDLFLRHLKKAAIAFASWLPALERGLHIRNITDWTRVWKRSEDWNFSKDVDMVQFLSHSWSTQFWYRQSGWQISLLGAKVTPLNKSKPMVRIPTKSTSSFRSLAKPTDDCKWCFERRFYPYSTG